MYSYLGQSFSDGSLGSLERRNPLPVGRYQIDVFANNIGKMTSWLKSTPSVRVVSTTQSGDTDDPQSYTEYVFTVSSPAAWDAVTFGYPDILSSTPTAPVRNPAPRPGGAAPSPKADAPRSPPITDNSLVLGAAAIAVIGLGLMLAWHSRKTKR